MSIEMILICVGAFFILLGLYGIFNKGNKLWGTTVGTVDGIHMGEKRYIEKTVIGTDGNEETEMQERQDMTVKYSYTLEDIYDFTGEETRDKSEFPPFMRAGTKTKIAYRKDDPKVSKVFYGSNTNMTMGGIISLVMGLALIALGIASKLNLIHGL
ncbi:MAG: DUF3592 domain-containing protein [Abditibacteriota bacterium]|nr:DUF3592 domain-containing protein [Abditibacteriota bacterium]